MCHHFFLFLHRTIKPADLNLNLNLIVQTRLHKRKGFISLLVEGCSLCLCWPGLYPACAASCEEKTSKHPPSVNSAAKFECLLLTAQVCCLLLEGKCKVALLFHPAGWKEPKAENSQPLAFLSRQNRSPDEKGEICVFVIVSLVQKGSTSITL